MVFWPKLSRRIWKEKSQKNFLLGPKVSELGPNLGHLSLQENALIFIPRLLQRRTFSFYAFSHNTNFHSPPSPTTLVFIPRLLLRRRLHRQNPTPSSSLLWWAGRHRPLASRSRTLPVKSDVWGMKDVRGERLPFQPLLGLTPPPPQPSNPYLSKHQKLLDHRRGGTKYLRLRLFSFPVFSQNAYLHYAPSPHAPIFIPRILLRRLFSLCVISYDAYIHSAHSPTALKEKRRRGKKMTLKKNSYGTKNANFRKNPLKHSQMTLKEHFTEFIFCLYLKKKCILRCRRRRRTLFGALSYGAF